MFITLKFLSVVAVKMHFQNVTKLTVNYSVPNMVSLFFPF